MEPALIIFTAWLLFGGSHLLLSGSPLRRGLVKKIGPIGFTICFLVVTIITLLGLIVAVFLYGDKGASNYQFVTHPAANVALRVIGVLGFVLMIGGLMNYPISPMARLAKQDRKAPDADRKKLNPASGIERLTRHPFFFGLALLMSVHVIVADTLAMAIYFAGFVMLAGVGIPLQDRKLRHKWQGVYQFFEKETSNIPFKGLVGSTVQTKAGERRKWALVTIGALVFILTFHSILEVANGTVFIMAILIFGLIAVLKALRSS